MLGTAGLILKARLERLRRDERGVTAVEFGLLALPFFAIIGAILQTSIIFLASQVLESAVHDASRTIRTGQAQSLSLEQFRTEVCDRLYGLFPDCAGLHVRVNVVSNFQSATVAPPLSQPCAAPCNWSQPESWATGTRESVVLVQVYYRYPVIVQLGPLGLSNMSDGRRLMGSATVFKNEPF
ncbi:TadE/TadG family type IV pilus assembly protein [Devosia lucknowensis]|uniref:TadE/TadG family type IV pilus assembly protein n=1 Tax=Devosia lucknowensis TaxID=1096929 RepID=UPI001481D442|nr:TadE/TadG family type IV pilus assembly protein [Devosia lucknowensis]